MIISRLQGRFVIQNINQVIVVNRTSKGYIYGLKSGMKNTCQSLISELVHKNEIGLFWSSIKVIEKIEKENTKEKII